MMEDLESPLPWDVARIFPDGTFQLIGDIDEDFLPSGRFTRMPVPSVESSEEFQKIKQQKPLDFNELKFAVCQGVGEETLANGRLIEREP